jgi:hypothetical protein
MARDHDAPLAEQLAMQQRRAALLDRILDGRPARDQAEELVFLLDGPFGVDWQTGQSPMRHRRRPGSRWSWSSARPSPWPWPCTLSRSGPTTATASAVAP